METHPGLIATFRPDMSPCRVIGASPTFVSICRIYSEVNPVRNAGTGGERCRRRVLIARLGFLVARLITTGQPKLVGTFLNAPDPPPGNRSPGGEGVKFAATIASNSAWSKAWSAQTRSTNSGAADVGGVMSGILDHSR